MCLGCLLEGHRCVVDSVEEGLVGLEAGVDEGDRAAQAWVFGEAEGEASGDGGCTRAARSGYGDESTRPPVPGRPGRSSELESVDAADRPGLPFERAGEFCWVEVALKHGCCAEPGPSFDVTTDDQDRAGGGSSPADELTVEAHGAVVYEEGREGTTGGEAIEQIGDAGAGEELVAGAEVGQAEVDGRHPGWCSGGKTQEHVAVGASRAGGRGHRRGTLAVHRTGFRKSGWDACTGMENGGKIMG